MATLLDLPLARGYGKVTALYDTIGRTYDNTRKADPAVVQRLWKLLQPNPGGEILDIGCGSGNYTVALQQRGVQCSGIDISEEMLSKARKKSGEIEWVLGDACKLPWDRERFDGAVSILATHHIRELTACFAEAYRVLKPGASFVLFTTTVTQMQSYWLWDYFPRMMKRACRDIEALGPQDERLKGAGFAAVTTEPFFITNDLCDWFLHAGKYRPAIYLDPLVRAGISCFSRPGFETEIESGLRKLQIDIGSGRIDELIQRYESNLGEYLFIKAVKDGI